MNKQIQVTFLILGLLLASTNCLDNSTTNQTGNNNNTSGGGGGATGGFDFGKAIEWQYNYVSALQVSNFPTGVANDIQPFLDDFVNMTANLDKAAVLMANNKSTVDQAINMTGLRQTWADLHSQEADVFMIISYSMQILETLKGRGQCFIKYNFADFQGYVGIKQLTTYFFNNDTSAEADYKLNLTYYCTTEYQITKDAFDDLLSIMLGEDEECDILKDLYDGYLPLQIWTGWRDYIANIYGYMLLDVQWNKMVQSACLTLNGVSDAASQVSQEYQDKMSTLVGIYRLYSDMAIEFQQQTALNNTLAAIGLLPNASAYVQSLNIDYIIPYVYPDQDWIIIVFDSTNVTSDDYNITCRHCVTLLDQNGLNIVVAWLPRNSTSSIAGFVFSEIGQNGSVETIVSDVYKANKDCISGVVTLNQNVKSQHVVSHLGDRYRTFVTPEDNVYLWGIKEECEGIPENS